LIECIVTGLDEEYTPLVSAICTRAEPISLSEFYSHILSFETHVVLLQDGHNKITNAANRGGGVPEVVLVCGVVVREAAVPIQDVEDLVTVEANRTMVAKITMVATRRTVQVISSAKSASREIMAECWHGFNEPYVPAQKTAALASNSYNIDTNWYADTGAAHHITGELEKLSI
jgi:hypothetical protein